MEDTSKKENPFTLPSLVATWKLPYTPQQSNDEHQFFDVEFCPYYSDSETGPIFAIVGCRDILLCGTKVDEDGLADVYHVLRDDEEVGPEGLPILNTISWAFIDESNPLLAVSGPSGQIEILDACSGSPLTTLVGHGAGLINDLAAHPIYPWILASASIDSSVRIWDLRRWEEKTESPCIVICGQGNGHKEGVLTIAWHSSGRYIVSGAHDNMVCVWTIPDLSDGSDFWTSISPEQRKSKSHAVHVIHYPHFVTSAVHSNYVDCVCFFSDMILSKAAEENKIVLWEMTGFDSQLPPPSSDSAPKTQEHKDTRNGFMRTKAASSNGNSNGAFSNSVSLQVDDEDKSIYIQHLEFELLDAAPFYMRFGLLAASADHPDLHPVLVCGNTSSQISIWDFKRLELGHTDGYQTLPPTGRPKYETYIEVPVPVLVKNTKKQSKAQKRQIAAPPRQTPGSQTSSSARTAFESPMPPPQPVPNRERYPISDPFKPIMPHKTIRLPDYPTYEKNTTFRGVSWSPCGKWCVVVGDMEGKVDGKREAHAALLSRWV